MIRDLESIINNEALEYALYTVEERAIPNMIDGFKPVHRFIMHRALEMSKNGNSFNKLASLAGSVSSAGYHHGESSAQSAGQAMANNWNNNIPFLEGQGNFGSRLVQEGAAARYVFCRVHENFSKIYKDSKLAPKHKDEEHKPPRHYLPLIPTVLLNGISGIATGYSTSILPHCIKSVISSTEQAVKGRKVKEPEVKFPKFNGDIITTDRGVQILGKYEWAGKRKLLITEVPLKYERADYIEKVLDKLEDNGIISSYDDLCSSEGFRFSVNVKQGDRDSLKHEEIIRMFGLSQNLAQFIVVIDENGKLRDDFSKASELIEHFVKVRLEYYSKRIDNEIRETTEKLNYAKAKKEFIGLVLKGDIELTIKTTKKELLKTLSENPITNGYEKELVALSIYHLTEEEFILSVKNVEELTKLLEKWNSTTPEEEYLQDLKDLKSAFK